jgi:UDP-N-acetyl-D-mannosaminuronic acid transferase (WecB/TagA/CpsF family)
MIPNAQQFSAPAFMAGDRPVTAEQVRQKLQSDAWSNVVVSCNGRYIDATGSLNEQAGKMAIDSHTGRLRAADGDDDEIKPRTPPRPERTRGRSAGRAGTR